MSYANRFSRIIAAIVIVVVLGTFGYVFIEKWSWFDALYMTFITISTVGFKEVHDLSMGGKIFTIFVIVGGTGTMLYTATTLVQYVLEGQLGNLLGRRRMNDEINRLSNHIILCGYGKVGQEVARVFRNEGVKFIVIEANQENATRARDEGYLCIHGDATNDEILKQAQISHARALITALATDADNLFVTLSAKSLKPDIFIVSRVYGEESEAKLKRAGADRTMSPYRIGGRRLAMLTLRPVVVDFIDRAMGTREHELTLEDIEVGKQSPVAGLTIKVWTDKNPGIQILAVRKKDKNLIANPAPDTRIEIGDELVVIGTRAQLKDIEGSV
ncbi:MAG: potassium channel protein [Dehalococcoidales bacterium]|nr:potassium channel protein [Dehalococcoidales bacterium]